MVKNLPSNAGDTGSIPGWGNKIPRAAGQLSLRTTTTELVRLKERACMQQTTEPACSGPHVPQLEGENPHAATREKPVGHNERSRMPQQRIPRAATKTRHSQNKQTSKQTQKTKQKNLNVR